MRPPSRPLRLRLWGVAPREAARQLREQAERFEREIGELRAALEKAQAEEAALTAQCEALSAQVEEARRTLEGLQKGLQQSRALAPVQALVLAREIADLEQEHAARMAELAAERERLRAEIAERRSSLQRWVTSLLQSVAERGTE